jgi:hypothetical protein
MSENTCLKRSKTQVEPVPVYLQLQNSVGFFRFHLIILARNLDRALKTILIFASCCVQDHNTELPSIQQVLKHKNKTTTLPGLIYYGYIIILHVLILIDHIWIKSL